MFKRKRFCCWYLALPAQAREGGLLVATYSFAKLY